MKTTTPSYSSSIFCSNENPTRAKENNILSSSYDSLSDLIVHLHKTFRVNNPNDRLVDEEDFENIKNEILKGAQNGKCHFAFGVLVVEEDAETENRHTVMFHPMTTRTFTNDMIENAKRHYKNNPSVRIEDYSAMMPKALIYRTISNLITLLTKEETFVLTALNQEAFDSTDKMLKETGRSARIESGILCYPTQESI